MPFILLSTLLIGAAGFLAGFVGPIILSPEANEGPLLGIFITGPLGLVAGAVLGVVLPWIIAERHRIRSLVGLSATTFLGILAGIACFKVWLVYRERKPWNLGHLTYVPQPLEAEREAYVAPAEAITSPGWFLARNSGVPSEWPPRNPGDFLGLVEVIVAPPELRPPGE